ncbi:MAG: hypothetical protein U9R02_12705 [Thermodesulfobacteriota bacterium]|nr:hypothetical protein [Thermodesulfobacteriota bacterium]
MSSSLAFDTLAYAKKLKETGFTEAQSEVQAEAMAEIIDERLATKQDLKELEMRLKQDILDLKRDIKELEMRLTIRLGALLTAGIVIVAALAKLL